VCSTRLQRAGVLVDKVLRFFTNKTRAGSINIDAAGEFDSSTILGGNALIHRFFQFAIVVALVSGFVQAQTKAPDTDSRNSALAPRAAEMGTGKWWVSLSDEARDRFIERYTKAMDRVMSALVTQCAEELKSLPRTGINDVDFISSMALCKIASSFDFNFGTHKELREGIDGFYKDSTNLSVPIDVAIQRVRDVLAAKHPRGAMGIG
jgi:hypothetical protein